MKTVKKILIEIYEKTYRKYVFCMDFIEKKKLGVPNVMSIDETIDYISENHCSVSRYGDGELKIISGENIRFQKFNSSLSRRLAEILHGKGKVLVCISDIFDNPTWMNERAYEYTWWIVAKNRRDWTNSLNLEYTYGNAFISRPYLDWREKEKSLHWFEKLKQIWNNQNIVFIEGNKSRLGYKNDLFDNAKTIRRILCPVRDAYMVYNQILKEAMNLPHDVLFLLALGPTATVLAEELAENGYWAIDIGHIDIEYEWFKMHALEKVPIKGKYTNEAARGEDVDDYVDEEFKNQIIVEIE